MSDTLTDSMAQMSRSEKREAKREAQKLVKQAKHDLNVLKNSLKPVDNTIIKEISGLKKSEKKSREIDAEAALQYKKDFDQRNALIQNSVAAVQEYQSSVYEPYHRMFTKLITKMQKLSITANARYYMAGTQYEADLQSEQYEKEHASEKESCIDRIVSAVHFGDDEFNPNNLNQAELRTVLSEYGYQAVLDAEASLYNIRSIQLSQNGHPLVIFEDVFARNRLKNHYEQIEHIEQKVNHQSDASVSRIEKVHMSTLRKTSYQAAL